MNANSCTETVRHDFTEMPLEGLRDFRTEFMYSGNGRRLLVIQEVGKEGDGNDIRLYRHEAVALRDYLNKVLA
jgi:hypothetical protein